MKNVPDDIRELEEKISRLRAREDVRRRSAKQNAETANVSVGVRVAVELLSAVVVGGALGFLLDRVAGTRPWFLVVFLLFGGAAGVLNVYRLAKEEEKQN